MGSTRRDIVCRTDKINVRTIDVNIKNPWRWEWLEKKIGSTFLGDVFRKIEKPGFAYCIVCSKEISYGSRGLAALSSHITQMKHLTIVEARKKNFALPGSCSTSDEICSAPYGLHPMYSSSVSTDENRELLTPLADRVANSEAMLLSFMAEMSLPFSLVPDLVDFIKVLSTDSKALGSLKMHRTTASYKLRFGVAKTFKEDLVQHLKEGKFSLNIDESTSKNNEKILTMLVNYRKDKFVTEHLQSVSVKTVDSNTIYNAIVEVFSQNELPWKNLMSVLLDSCNVMRGKKAGVEVKLREKCPHLLDIDGDSCHHAHNAAKVFCKPFNSHLETLFQDVFNDFKWSSDLRAAFREICELLNVKYTVPQNYISFRWLSVYDVCEDFSRLYSAYVLFYFSFLKKTDKLDFLHEVVKIYKSENVQKTVRDHIHQMQRALGGKKMTDAGRERKARITKKLFVSSLQTKLTLNFYLSVLPLLKEYIKLFQSQKPLIHKLHDKQIDLIKGFLACFIKPEILKLVGNNPKKIKNLAVAKDANHLPVKSIFIGEKAKELILSSSKANACHVKSFQSACLKAYVSCSQSLLAKMPIGNPFLQAVSAIDQMCRQSSLALKFMKELPLLVKNVISPEEKEHFELEVQNYHADALLAPPCENENTDEWWISLEKSYPLLSKMCCALLTCFHGPRVESSFSIMNCVIKRGNSRLNVETFDAIQTIKYHLMAEGKSSSTYFGKKDFLHDKIERNLVKNLRYSCKSYEDEKLEKRNKKEVKMISLKLAQKKAISKEAAKKIFNNAAKVQRLKHNKKMQKKIHSLVSSGKDKGSLLERQKKEFLSIENKNKVSVSVQDMCKEKASKSVEINKEKNCLVPIRKDLETSEDVTSLAFELRENSSCMPRKRTLGSSKSEGPKKKKQKQNMLTITEMFARNAKKKDPHT